MYTQARAVACNAAIAAKSKQLLQTAGADTPQVYSIPADVLTAAGAAWSASPCWSPEVAQAVLRALDGVLRGDAPAVTAAPAVVAAPAAAAATEAAAPEASTAAPAAAAAAPTATEAAVVAAAPSEGSTDAAAAPDASSAAAGSGDAVITPDTGGSAVPVAVAASSAVSSGTASETAAAAAEQNGSVEQQDAATAAGAAAATSSDTAAMSVDDEDDYGITDADITASMVAEEAQHAASARERARLETAAERYACFLQDPLATAFHMGSWPLSEAASAVTGNTATADGAAAVTTAGAAGASPSALEQQPQQQPQQQQAPTAGAAQTAATAVAATAAGASTSAQWHEQQQQQSSQALPLAAQRLAEEGLFDIVEAVWGQEVLTRALEHVHTLSLTAPVDAEAFDAAANGDANLGPGEFTVSAIYRVYSQYLTTYCMLVVTTVCNLIMQPVRMHAISLHAHTLLYLII
jgi:hypothetical protein